MLEPEGRPGFEQPFLQTKDASQGLRTLDDLSDDPKGGEGVPPRHGSHRRRNHHHHHHEKFAPEGIGDDITRMHLLDWGCFDKKTCKPVHFHLHKHHHHMFGMAQWEIDFARCPLRGHDNVQSECCMNYDLKLVGAGAKAPSVCDKFIDTQYYENRLSYAQKVERA